MDTDWRHVNPHAGHARAREQGAGILVETGGAPTVRDNRIRDGIFGVFVDHQSRGLFERNDILGTLAAGVVVVFGGTPVLRNNRVQ